jgi:hypothetical protein
MRVNGKVHVPRFSLLFFVAVIWLKLATWALRCPGYANGESRRPEPGRLPQAEGRRRGFALPKA